MARIRRVWWFLGFYVGDHLVSTRAEIVLGQSVWGGEGDTEADFVKPERFCIVAYSVSRKESKRVHGMDAWTPFATGSRLRALSKIVGTEMLQKPFRW